MPDGANNSLYLDMLMETLHEPVAILSAVYVVKLVNPAFYRTFGLRPHEVLDRCIYDLGPGMWNSAKLRQLLEIVLPQDTAVENYPLDHQMPRKQPLSLYVNARQIELGEALLGVALAFMATEVGPL